MSNVDISQPCKDGDRAPLVRSTDDVKGYDVERAPIIGGGDTDADHHNFAPSQQARR